jgi:hypothetical protein
MVNKSADKRELMLLRESIKSLSIFLLGVLTVFIIYQYNVTYSSKQEKNKVEQEQKVEIITQKKIPTDLKNVCVVIKVSKDFRKYFISYKKYYTNNSYKIIIDEISFSEFMMLESKDTLTITRFNNNKI